MFTEEIIVENIKCGGCANSIKKGLEKIEEGVAVQVEIEEGKVTLQSDHAIDKELYIKSLGSMGYPIPGEGNLIKSAQSYVSCMIGRLQN
jgi:copper chaperone